MTLYRFITMISVFVFCGINIAHAGDDAYSLQEKFISISKNASEAVVGIRIEIDTEKNDQELSRKFLFNKPRVGIGSGLIITPDGYVLTNEHVVAKAKKILVRLTDGREIEAKVAGSDPRRDIALLKMKGEGFPVIELGVSKSIQIGQWAIAIGHPFGFFSAKAKPTVTVGVISALHRQPSKSTNRYYGNLIQTDAAINQGNSGGPLLNIDGKVIGINVMIFSSTGQYAGMSFAIPIDDVRIILDDLKAGNPIKYGWLGIHVSDLDQKKARDLDLKEVNGALVSRVIADSPAFEGGLKDNDIIIKLNGHDVEDGDVLMQIVGRMKVGSKCDVRLIRDGQTLNLTVLIGERPDDQFLVENRVWRGMKVVNISTREILKYKLKIKKGIVVVRVADGSKSKTAGFKEGYVILAIGDKDVDDLKQFDIATKDLKGTVKIVTDIGNIIVEAIDKDN